MQRHQSPPSAKLGKLMGLRQAVAGSHHRGGQSWVEPGHGEQGEMLLLCPRSPPAVPCSLHSNALALQCPVPIHPHPPAVPCPLHSDALAASVTAGLSELAHPLGPPARAHLPPTKAPLLVFQLLDKNTAPTKAPQSSGCSSPCQMGFLQEEHKESVTDRVILSPGCPPTFCRAVICTSGVA